MPHVRIVTDSACDIPPAEAARNNLCILPIPITVDGVTKIQGADFQGAQEFYALLQTAKEIPKTAQINPNAYYEQYAALYAAGTREVVVITLNSLASGTHQNAHTAREQFYSENEQAKERMNIHIVDSKCYSIAYGHPALIACEMAAANASSEEIVAYLEHWFSRMEIYVAAYSLEYARKSGRIGTASAVIGSALGMRPIIQIAGGAAKTFCTVRGSAAVADKLAEIVLSRMGADNCYGILRGTLPDVDELLRKKIFKSCRTQPFCVQQAGPAIAINIGPKMLGVGVLTGR